MQLFLKKGDCFEADKVVPESVELFLKIVNLVLAPDLVLFLQLVKLFLATKLFRFVGTT